MPEQDPFEARARLWNLEAQYLRGLAAKADLNAAAARATGALHRFIEAMAAGDASDVAHHPDLAELNVQLDGYYE